jgi:DNA-binding transcriptional MerR regulator
MKYYSIGEFSTLIGKTPQTLWEWHKKGSFISEHVSDGGTRYYPQEQLNHFLGIKGIETKTKKGLNQLIDMITNSEVEIIDNTERIEEKELVEDLIQIVHASDLSRF